MLSVERGHRDVLLLLKCRETLILLEPQAPLGFLALTSSGDRVAILVEGGALVVLSVALEHSHSFLAAQCIP